MRRRMLVAAVGVAIAAVALGAALRTRSDSAAGVDHTYTVPAGTAARLAAGDAVEILPRDLEVRVGDRLVVINDDLQAHEVGPWTVPPEKTFAFRFKQVGRYDSRCTLHRGGGRFFIDVLAP